MKRRILEGRKLGEKGIHKLGQLSITVGIGCPVIGREHRWHRNGVHLLAIRNQVRIVLRVQSRRQIVGLQRFRVVDRHQMEPIVLERAHGLIRLAPSNDHGVDFTVPHLLQWDALLDIDDVRLEAEPLEHGQRGDEGAAIGKVDADGLAVEIVQIADRFRGYHMHLLIVELGYVGKLLLDVLREALPLEIIERVGAHDAKVDALKEQNIGDALHRATADNGKYAQLVSVVEHGSQVRTELNIGAADGAGYQRHRVGVQRLLGGGGAELKDGLEAVADLGRVILGLFGPGCEAASHHGGNECQSNWGSPVGPVWN